jgi:hypothetical protein
MGQDQIHQGIEKSIVDEMRPSHCRPLRERAGGSCDGGSVCDMEDELRLTSEKAERSPPLSATHAQCNQMNQESQNNTEVRGISSEERLWEKTIKQQRCQQKEQEDEDEDNIEAITSENKGPINYCQQIEERLQHQQVEGETIVVMAPPSQDRQHSVKPYHKDYEDNADDEDEDVRPPTRRKRRHIESDATEAATHMKVHTRSSTIAQAQTCTTQGSTVSRSPPADAESVLGAGYQEYPLQGFLKCVDERRLTT